MRKVLIGLAIAAVLSGCGATTALKPVTTSNATVTAKKTPAELAAATRARKAAARAAARARTRALVVAKRRAKARAKAAAIAYAASNRWHQGYRMYSDSLAFKWLGSGSFSCADYALNGCWKIEVLAHEGCNYLEVDSNEMKGGAIVGQLIANQANVPPDTPVIFELDADAANISEASAPTISCD